MWLLPLLGHITNEFSHRNSVYYLYCVQIHCFRYKWITYMWLLSSFSFFSGCQNLQTDSDTTATFRPMMGKLFDCCFRLNVCRVSTNSVHITNIITTILIMKVMLGLNPVLQQFLQTTLHSWWQWDKIPLCQITRKNNQNVHSVQLFLWKLGPLHSSLALESRNSLVNNMSKWHTVCWLCMERRQTGHCPQKQSSVTSPWPCQTATKNRLERKAFTLRREKNM